MTSSPDLVVDWCSYEAAKYAVMKWHYSGRMPKMKQVYIGAWEKGKYIGAIIFGFSVTPYLGFKYGMGQFECTELTRVALKEHQAPVSKIVSIAIKMLKKQSPGLRAIISYADPVQEHYGTIYQALNWLYLGESAKVIQRWWRNQWRNDSWMNRYFINHPEERAQAPSRRLPGKYKYLYPLDRAMRRQIAPLAQPYPKKIVRPIDGNNSGDQLGNGGSTPTRTLISVDNE